MEYPSPRGFFPLACPTPPAKKGGKDEQSHLNDRGPGKAAERLLRGSNGGRHPADAQTLVGIDVGGDIPTTYFHTDKKAIDVLTGRPSVKMSYCERSCDKA